MEHDPRIRRRLATSFVALDHLIFSSLCSLLSDEVDGDDGQARCSSDYRSDSVAVETSRSAATIRFAAFHWLIKGLFWFPLMRGNLALAAGAGVFFSWGIFKYLVE